MTSKISLILLIFLLFSCTANGLEKKLEITNPKQLEFNCPSLSANAATRNIFVFMDGTANNPEVPTNVFRLYQAIEYSKGNATVCASYIEGVGNAKDPLRGLSGQAFALGMEERILRGYKFITKNYRPGDRIFIFGFSRGAHTARSLAGLISYAGVPKLENANDSLWDHMGTSGWSIGNKILELTREQIDINHSVDWRNWKRGDAPILESLIKAEKSIIGRSKNIEVQSAEVEFLGVWDTVPGSQGIEFFDETDLVCKQSRDSSDERQRYQIDSYPPIHHIAHAVSNDEKRSEFKPLFLCSRKIDDNSVHNEELTKLDEVIFPGAHADVGGGYDHKNNQLPDISLKWMIEQLGGHFLDQQEFIEEIGKNLKLKPEPKGLANLSISDSKGSTLSKCSDRKFPSNITFHDSIADRDNAGVVPWLYFDNKPRGNYPEQSCKVWVNPKDRIKEEKTLCIKQSDITCGDLM